MGCEVLTLGHPCTMLTDHASCLLMVNTPKRLAKLTRSAMAIQEMDLEIKHRSGRSNAGAAALSRSRCDATSVNAVTTDSVAPTKSVSEADTTIDSVDSFSLTLSETTQQKLCELSTMQKSCEELKSVYVPC